MDRRAAPGLIGALLVALAIEEAAWRLIVPTPSPEHPVEPWTAGQEDRIAYCGLVARVGWDIHHEQVRALVSRERHPGTVQWEVFDRMDEEVRKCSSNSGGIQ